jgi:hypothetical protein
MFSPRLLAAATVAALAVPSAAHAGPGFRVGLIDDPDSVFFGFQYRAPLTPMGPGTLTIKPGVDLAIVDGPVDFMLRGTLHFEWIIPVNRNVALYPLLGPGIYYVNADGIDDTEVGLDVGFGALFKGFSLELWVGAVDAPDLTLSVAFSI